MAPTTAKPKTTEAYLEAIGRRKTATATVRLTEAGKTSFVINGKELDAYFPTQVLRATATSPLRLAEVPGTFSVSVKVSGGGIASQAEAARHGLARALVLRDAGLRSTLKKLGFLKRDARAKERRKFGLKKARKAPQWSKR